jgi:hypothetical protein
LIVGNNFDHTSALDTGRQMLDMGPREKAWNTDPTHE